MANDRPAHGQGVFKVDMALQRRVFAVAQLDDARDLHEVDAGAIIEGTGDRRAGNDQHVEAAIFLHQRMGDRATPAQMAEAERVVAVHEDAGMFEASAHGASLRAPAQFAFKQRRLFCIRYPNFTYRGQPHRVVHRLGS
jgi:hypothetical protein